MREDYLSGSDDGLNAGEKEVERALRPLSFEDFTGQQKVVDNIKVFGIIFIFHSPNDHIRIFTYQ